MKVRYLFLLSLLFLVPDLEAQEQYMLSESYSNLSFYDFVIKAEKSFDIKFFYRKDWVKDLKVGDYPQCTTLSCLLTNLFQGTSLHFLIEESGNIVITNNYAIKVTSVPVEKDAVFLPPTDYLSSEETLQTGNTYVEVGNPAEKNNPGDVIVSGYITNKDTKEPVSGVTVFEKKLATGTISNEYGYYTLKIPRGVHQLRFSFIGMREKPINLNLYGTGELDVQMNSVLIPLKETIISAQKSITLQRFEVGVEKININSFRVSPTSLGESDIIKNVLLIPGVQSVGEGSTGFNVRGGSADQNLILLYGSPVYNSSHFFGFFSAVNSDIIKDVTLYKGGIPARYGGRISSVLDIGTQDGNRKEFEGSAGISPITTHLKLEGPLIKDTLTYILTARTTYSNYIFKLLQNQALKNSKASFYDLNGKFTYDLNKNNKITLSSYYSHDDFSFNSDTVYSYNNTILALAWRHFFTSRFFSSFSFNNSSYEYNISSTTFPPEAFILTHKVNSSGFKADFNWFPGNHEFNFGMDLNRYIISPGNYQPYSDSSLVEYRSIEKLRALEAALYFDDKFVITNFLSLDLGIRLSSWFAYGPQTVMVYDPNFSKSIATITDTLFFKPGSIIKSYAGPELRASLNFRITDRNSFKINYNRTRQYLHLLSNSSSISPTDTWNLSGYYLKPQTGDQIALGFYELLSGNRFEASAEMYYKGIKNMVDFKGGTNLIMDNNIEKDIVNVKGKAYGLEFVFKKTEGKLRYSIGYTYSRTFIRSMGSFSEEIINSGKWVPANFDKPNDLVITFNYFYSRRLSFSANYIWSSGRPITYPVATYIMYDDPLIHYSDRNKYRIPDYSRLDLSLRVNGSLMAHKLANPNWTFSVYNLLGKENVYSVYFKKEGDQFMGYKLSVFGKAIPSVTFSFDF